MLSHTVVVKVVVIVVVEAEKITFMAFVYVVCFFDSLAIILLVRILSNQQVVDLTMASIFKNSIQQIQQHSFT